MPTHTQFMSLPLEDRLIVSRMASILRIADALDNSHNQIVEDLNIKLTEENIIIEIKLSDNTNDFLDLLKLSVKKKGDMFESFFGYKIIIERML